MTATMTHSTAVAIKRERIRQECERLGVSIIQRGRCYHLLAPGIDVIVTDLSVITLDNLQPASGWKK